MMLLQGETSTCVAAELCICWLQLLLFAVSKLTIMCANLHQSQNLETLDVSTLTPLTPEVISRQATINIGMLRFLNHHQRNPPQSTPITMKTTSRYHWARGARQIHRRQVHLWRPNRAL